MRFGARLVQDNGTHLELANLGGAPVDVQVFDLSYGQAARAVSLGRDPVSVPLDLASSHNWYDLEVITDGQVLRLAGYVETGADGLTDPAAYGAALLNVETKDMILSRS